MTAGPRFDYFANYGKGEYKFTSLTTTDDFADNLKSFVIGNSVSFGLQISVSEKYEISVELRYNYDLTNSTKEPFPHIIKIKHMIFGLVWSFEFGQLTIS